MLILRLYLGDRKQVTLVIDSETQLSCYFHAVICNSMKLYEYVYSSRHRYCFVSTTGLHEEYKGVLSVI